jgi:uncharacterized protein (TIGR04376 family)
MSLFDDINQFLEERLDEFLQDNPHLELQAIEEQLREQERDTQQIITELQLKEKRLQEEILTIAQDIQTWHGRIKKAQASGKEDLAKAAGEREAALLRQGNQLWGQMEGVKTSIGRARELLVQIQQKRRETQAQYQQVRDNRANSSDRSDSSVGWNRGADRDNNYSRASDPLEAEFQKWELDEEIERMKK